MTTKTDAQLDGIACIECGREDTVMVPTGEFIAGVQMFKCAQDCTK